MMTTSVLPLWLFPINSPLKEISSKEKQIAESLPPKRSQQYKHARGYVRFALSQYLKIDPLEIPLKAPPGEAPKLDNQLGYVSFGHCIDALIIGWSPNKLGIDIERSDRFLSSHLIAKRFFHFKDLEHLKMLTGNKLINEVLNQWVVKESVIKWQRGTIASDLKQWVLDYKSNIATHKTLNLKVNFYKIKYRDWIISISTNQHIKNNNLIVCNN